MKNKTNLGGHDLNSFSDEVKSSDEAITLYLVMDKSPSMGGGEKYESLHPEYKDLLRRVKLLCPQAVVKEVNFSDKIEEREFKIEAYKVPSIDELYANRGLYTRLNDALASVFKDILKDKREGGKFRAFVWVFSDGNDTGSFSTARELKRALDRVRHTDTTVAISGVFASKEEALTLRTWGKAVGFKRMEVATVVAETPEEIKQGTKSVVKRTNLRIVQQMLEGRGH